MTKVNKGTKKAEALNWEWKHCYVADTVEGAYSSGCSQTKRSTFSDIWFRANNTEGYNHDLKVTSANCYNYSTMYSFTNEDGTFIVKDTKENTYITELC